MEPTIQLAFVDDWDLSGDGSGAARELQIAPMRELVRISNSRGIRGSFNAEVMQQLAFRNFQTDPVELKTQAGEWDTAIQETYHQRQDVQLHIHPQWTDADYEDGKWNLKGDWS